MNSRSKRPFTQRGSVPTPTDVRLAVPAFAPDARAFAKTRRTLRGLADGFEEQDNSPNEPLPAARITQVVGKVAPQRHMTLDEVIDALQLLTVTDVCKLLRISKPTLWRLRRSGDFPDPTTVTERIFGWRRWEIDAWLASRSSSRRY